MSQMMKCTEIGQITHLFAFRLEAAVGDGGFIDVIGVIDWELDNIERFR
jgi:hypothetical protein